MIFHFTHGREHERDQWVTQINTRIRFSDTNTPGFTMGAPVSSGRAEQQPELFFCNICGHKIVDGSLFCDHCGTKIQTAVQLQVDSPTDDKVISGRESPQISAEKIIWSPRTAPDSEKRKYDHFSDDAYSPEINTPVRTPGTVLKRISLKAIAICIGLIILVILIGPVLLSMGASWTASLGSQTPAADSSGQSDVTVIRTVSPSSDTIVSKSFSDFVLTISDLPGGWKVKGSPTVTDEKYLSEFQNADTGSSAVTLSFGITRFPTIDAAKSEYSRKKTLVTKVKVSPISAGNEGFAYLDCSQTTAVFRKGNLVISVSTVRLPAVPVALVTGYAQKVSGRI